MNLLESFRHRKDLLKQVGAMHLAPTYGANTIAISSDVFAEIDPAFNEHNTPEPWTKAASLKVYELRRDATFREMFGWLAKGLGTNLESLCMTQNQITELAHRCPHWLINSDKAAIMLFKSRNQLCVATMSIKKEEKFRVNFFILDYPVPWLGEFHHLVVIPQYTE